MSDGTYGMKSEVSYNRATGTWQATIVIDASNTTDLDKAVETVRDLLQAGSLKKRAYEPLPE